MWTREVQTERDGGVSDYLCACHGGRAQKQSY